MQVGAIVVDKTRNYRAQETTGGEIRVENQNNEASDLFNPIHYSEIQIDGVVYNSANECVSALNKVIYNNAGGSNNTSSGVLDANIQEMINKPNTTEIIGCIKMNATYQFNIDDFCITNSLVKNGIVSYVVGGVSSNNILYTNYTDSNGDICPFRSPSLNTNITNSNEINSVQVIENMLYIDSTIDLSEVILTLIDATTGNIAGFGKTIQGTAVGGLQNVNGSLVKQFDKTGKEIIENRKYYIKGNPIPSDKVLEFTEGKCNNEVVKGNNNQENLENTTKTYTNLKSISFSVYQGTADVTINGNLITYPIGGVKGTNFSDKNGLKNDVVIDATNGKVIIHYIN